MKAYSSSGHKTRKSIHLPSFPTGLLRRTLFLRKHHPMDYPPFCLALRSLSSSLLYWLYCDVRFRSCCTYCAFSRYRFNSHWKLSFRNLPLNLFIYYLISVMIRKRTVPSLFPSCTFPVSESDYVGFLFVRRTQWTVTWSFKISDAVIHHFSLCTQLRKIFNCNCFKLWLNCFRWRMYLPFLFLINYSNVCWRIGKIWESSEQLRLPLIDSAELLFGTVPVWPVLWDWSYIRILSLRTSLNWYWRMIGELLVTFSWSTLWVYYSQTPSICQLIFRFLYKLSLFSDIYIQLSTGIF